MRESKKLTASAALTVAAAALIGVSAFAETRPENETRVRRDAGGAVRRDATATTTQERGRDETRNGAAARGTTPRNAGSSVEVRGSRRDTERTPRAAERREIVRRERDRDEAFRNRGEDSSRRTEADRERSSRGRNDDVYRERNDRNQRQQSARGRHETRGRNDRYDSRHDSRSRNSYRHGREPYYAQGRVSRVHRHGNGYRVWVHGSRYPFFVPLSHWHHDRFRVGLMIRLGGWYNDGGYYDYYDDRSQLYGVVESIDYRRNTLLVRNEVTGHFVTVRARDYDVDRLRIGDLIELEGRWRDSRFFEARDIDLVDRW